MTKKLGSEGWASLLKTLNTQNRSKINRLIREWPKGTVSTVSYLQAHGFSRKLLNKYKNSGWLSSLGHGAYKAARNPSDLQRGVITDLEYGGSNIPPNNLPASFQE